MGSCDVPRWALWLILALAAVGGAAVLTLTLAVAASLWDHHRRADKDLR